MWYCGQGTCVTRGCGGNKAYVKAGVERCGWVWMGVYWAVYLNYRLMSDLQILNVYPCNTQCLDEPYVMSVIILVWLQKGYVEENVSACTQC